MSMRALARASLLVPIIAAGAIWAVGSGADHRRDGPNARGVAKHARA
jgi:hypothetical protein